MDRAELLRMDLGCGIVISLNTAPQCILNSGTLCWTSKLWGIWERRFPIGDWLISVLAGGVHQFAPHKHFAYCRIIYSALLSGRHRDKQQANSG